jgi:sporulation protein YlmC with PRC-barrel domain
VLLGVLWPAGYDPVVTTVRINAPAGALGIGRGMEVESSDGHEVGSVDALETDPTSGDVTGFVVKHGFLFSQDTHMPMTDTSGVRDGKVILNVTKDQVKDRENASSRYRGIRLAVIEHQENGGQSWLQSRNVHSRTGFRKRSCVPISTLRSSGTIPTIARSRRMARAGVPIGRPSSHTYA